MRRMLVVLVMLSTIMIGGRSFAHDSRSSIQATAGPSRSPEEPEAVDGLTRRLLDLHARRLSALDAGERQNALNKLLTVAAARQGRLAALMQDHPGEVIRAALAAGVRAALPPEVRTYVEEEVALEGELDVLHEDGASGSRYLHWLDLGRSRMSLHFAATPPVLQSGDRVRVRGIRVDQALALDSGDNQVTVLAAALANTFGAQKTAVILVAFQNQPAVASATPATARDVVFGPASSVSRFFDEASYQQTWLTGSVFGPYTIPVNSGSACDYYGIANAAEQAATTNGINLSTYSRRVYAFPLNSCAWWGLGTVGGSPSRAWINGSFVTGVVAHEMGHNLGLYHSHALECGSVTIASNCSNVEYGDTLDVMGDASPAKHFNAAQKERLGWLNYGASPPITTVQSTGVYTIDPYEPLGSNPKALKVRVPSGDWYYMEYRQPIGFDNSTVSTNANVRNGIVVHLVSNNDPRKIYLLDMTPETSTWIDPALGVNESFTDTAAGLTISPAWANGTNAGVNIGVASSCVRGNPAVIVSPASQQGAAGLAVTYTVSVTNNDTGCAPSSFIQQAVAPSGWTVTFVAATLTIGSAASASTTLNVTPPGSAAAGTYTITSTATRSTDTASGTATYAVGGSGGAGSFTDGFDRANSANLGHDWQVVKGNLTIQGGQVVGTAVRSLHTAVAPGLAGATQRVTSSFAVTEWASGANGPRVGVIVRYQGPGNYYTCYRQMGAAHSLRIAKVVNGAEKILKRIGLANPEPGELFNLGCRAEGSKLIVELEGGDRATVTDSAFSQGSVGFAIGFQTPKGKSSTSPLADNFAASVQ